MKTRNRIIALLEIAIVLCSVFLVALPAIAADQNQTMQKMTAGTITASSKDDYVLGIYGNANEDDTIDMRDLTYVKLIFFGKKPETELADAKYDGKINPLDFIQIKLIIVGKEKEITIVDVLGEAVTVRKPVKRVVVMRSDSAEVLRVLNAKDKIVGVTKQIQDQKVYLPEISKLPVIAESWGDPDYEAILNLNPDVILTFGGWASGGAERQKEWKEKLPGVMIISLDTRMTTSTENVKILGYILDREEEAGEFTDWREGYFNTIKARTGTLSDDKKPKVFLWWTPTAFKGVYKTAGNINRLSQMCVIAGGRNIAENLKGHWPTVDPEWVIEQNPDIILITEYSSYIPCGYDVDDSSGLASLREEVMNRPELAYVTAVKTKSVYIMEAWSLSAGPCSIVALAYQAKWFHPDLFEDLDPKAIHQEYLDRFQGLDYDLDKHGVFVYPPLED